MNWYRGSTLLVVVALGVISAWGRTPIGIQPNEKTNFNISLDSTFSPVVAKELTSYIRTTKRLRATDMKKKFPSIQNVTIESLPPNVMRVRVGNTSPLCTLNRDTVLNQQGAILSPSYFSQDVLNRLPDVSVSRPDHIYDAVPIELITFLTSLDPEIFKDFTVHWKDDTQIYFFSKTKPYWAFVISSNQYPDKKKIHVCKKIVKESTNGQAQPSNVVIPVVDLRFNGQAIVEKKRRDRLKRL